MKKTYKLVKFPKTLYCLGWISYIILAMLGIAGGAIIILIPGKSAMAAHIVTTLAVLAFECAILFYARALKIDKIKFGLRIHFEESGIFINDTLFLKWGEVKSSGTVEINASEFSNSVLDYIFVRGKIIFFSSKILDEEEKKSLNGCTVMPGLLSMQYRDDIIFDVKNYFPDFDTNVQHFYSRYRTMRGLDYKYWTKLDIRKNQNRNI